MEQHMVRRIAATCAVMAALLLSSAPASAGGKPCSRVVVFTLPGISWEDVTTFEPPTLLDLVDEGAMGSMAVRTVSSRTSYASGFATIGAGNRLDGGFTTGSVASDQVSETVDLVASDVVAGGLAELRGRAEVDAYGAVPGALGSALAEIPTIAVGNADPSIETSPLGFGRYTLLATMDTSGTTDLAAVGSDLLLPDEDAPFGVATDPEVIATAVDRALEQTCSMTVIDQGDLVRAELFARITGSAGEGSREQALMAADDLLEHVVDLIDLETDTLLVLSPTSPFNSDDVHFGIAVAVGPGFEPGEVLRSPSTRRPGMVTLPDVAPTILQIQGSSRPGSMSGRPMVAEAGDGSDRIADAIELDRESVFTDRARTPAVTTFVIFQIAVYAVIYLVLRRRRAEGPSPGLLTALELATLAVVAFPLATYIIGVFPSHEMGGWWFGVALVVIDAALVALTAAVANRSLDRLLVLTGATVALLFIDLMTGSNLQLNTVLSYSPFVAGRFAGIGNIAFGVLTGAVLVTGTLILHRWGVKPAPVAVVAAIFVLAVVVDGAPDFGSDVGGVIALVPGLAITLMLLTGRRPSVKVILLSALAMLAAVGAFLALDLSRPEQDQTHLARLYEDVRSEGPEVFADTILRKVRTNLRVFRTTIWTYGVPPALAVIAWLVLRPRGRWRTVASRYPRLQAGLVSGLILGALGFAVNDSGIVVPAVILAFLVPMALIIHMNVRAAETP